MNYIGPFLRINRLNTENIYNQLKFLSRESVNHIVLNSKCGIYTNTKDLNLKINIPNVNSPLLCIYKKASPKLDISQDKFLWNENKFKKIVDISSNGLMTLNLLELIDYYNEFKDKDKNLFSYSKLYSNLCKKQLEFFALNLRNTEGVFVDKLDESDLILGNFSFKDKNNKFHYYNQALLMCAYYKCSLLGQDDYCNNFNKFSLDILDMFINFNNELYELSTDELSKLCLALNVFYDYSKNEKCKLLLLDLSELLIDKYNDCIDSNNICLNCISCLDFMLLYNNLGISKFKDFSNKIKENLLNIYDENLSIFVKGEDKKQINYDCTEIMLYYLTFLYSNSKFNDVDSSLLVDLYKNLIVDSGLILSWPDIPTLDSAERYKNFSLKSQDLLPDEYFKLPSIPNMKNIELAPVFAKYITFNKKNHEFTKSRLSFISNKNLLIDFLNLYLLK